MGQVILSKCLVTTEDDWLPIVLRDEYCEKSLEQGALQETQSKQMNLKDRAINKNSQASLYHTVFSKRSEYAIKQWAGDQARVTQPGEFHNYPDVGQVNVRWCGDPQDGLMIQERDQGNLPIVFTVSKDPSFQDKTIWLVGWGMTDLLRRHFVLINQFRDNKNWGIISNMQSHEQFVYPRSMLNPMKTLSKEFVNTPFIL